METMLFPFSEYWWFYAAFTAFVLAMLALDLGVFHREAHEVSMREATVWSIVWIALALSFNAGLYYFTSSQIAVEFLTGYVVEKALSIDNLFVFVVIFAYFGIPARYQHRVLFYGILGALVFRAIFIAAGSVLMQYHLIVVLLGIFLIATGVKMAFTPERAIDPNKNLLVRLFRRFFPVTPELHGERFFVRVGGAWHGTPLLLALLFLEATDVIFAIDSVPAIFALTKEPLIVFTSNMFAILGLRSLYFLLAGAVDRFHLLKYGLAAVLVFVGLKMAWLNDLFGGKFPIGVSLAIIGGLVGASMLLSFLVPAAHPTAEDTERAP
jgi:tellurite resistance protein TerC